ncbi:PAS domain-containing protein, partial [Streptomyces palmae]
MSSRPSRGAARLAAILDALPDALLLVNCNGTVVNANHIALETFETPGTALVGRGLLDLLPAFDSKRIPGGMRRPTDAEAARTRPTRMIARRTDGVQFPVEVTSANLEDGRTPYADQHSYTGDELLMLVVRDLTGTVDTEAELARQQRQTEMILRAAAEGVVGVDTEGKVVLVNPAAAQILGYRASDLGGQELHPLVHHSRPDGTPFPYEESPLADTLRSGRKHRVRGQTLWSKSGDQVPVDLTTAPVRDGDQLVGAVMTFTDRRAYDQMVAEQNERYDTMLAEQTERYDTMLAEQNERYDAMLAEQTERYDTMLAEQNERARALEARHAERERSLSERNAQLLAVLGESLRGPLLQLRAELGTLASDPAGQLWPEANQILHHLAAGYSRMTTLVDNVLSFQSLEAGQEQLDRHPVTLDGVIAAGVEGAVELIGPGRAQFAVHAPPIEAEVDPERLIQALAHLIADVAGVDSTGHAAGAATGDSTIVVAAAQRGEVARIEVRGPYPGGDPVHQPIVRGVVRRHGGVLQTHQLPGGHGSAYVLEVPLTAAAAAAADGIPAGDGAGSTAAGGTAAGRTAVGGAATGATAAGAGSADGTVAGASLDSPETAAQVGTAAGGPGVAVGGAVAGGAAGGTGSSGVGAAGIGAAGIGGSGVGVGEAVEDGVGQGGRTRVAGGPSGLAAAMGRRARRNRAGGADAAPLPGDMADGSDPALADGTVGGPAGALAHGTHGGPGEAFTSGTHGGPGGVLAGSAGAPGSAGNAQGVADGAGARGPVGGDRHGGPGAAARNGTVAGPAGATTGGAREATAGIGGSAQARPDGPGAVGPRGAGAQNGTESGSAAVPPPTGRRRARRDPQEEQSAGGDPHQAAGPYMPTGGPQPVPATGVPLDAGYPAPTGRRARRAVAGAPGAPQPPEAAGPGRAAFALPPATADSGQQPGGLAADGTAEPQPVAPGTGRRRARPALPEAGQGAASQQLSPQAAAAPDGGRTPFALPPAEADRTPQGALPAGLAPAGLVPAQGGPDGAPHAAGGAHRQGDWAQHAGGPGPFPGTPQGAGPRAARPDDTPHPAPGRRGQGPGDAARPAPGGPGDAPYPAPGPAGAPVRATD